MTTTASRHTVTAVFRDRRGVTALYFTVVITAMVLVAVAALDLMRVHLVRSRLWAATDAALLAAGNALGNANWKTVALAYFNANMGKAYMGATVTATADDFTTASSNGSTTIDTVSLKVSAKVPLLSTGLLSLSSLDVSAEGSAQRQGRVAEVVMALDNTGSMAGSKLSSMKTAAKTLVKMLTGEDAGGNSVVGLVPFNETVRIKKADWLEDSTAKPLTVSSWNGCLMERTGKDGAFIFDTTTPATTQFTPYMSKQCYSSWFWPYTKTCEFINKNPQTGCVKSPTQFLTSSKDTLDSAINAMQADGSTMIASGMVWGWRMLDPSWRGTDSKSWGDLTLPKDKSDKLQKVVVLLTDGDNAVSSGNPYRSPFGDPTDVTYNDPSGLQTYKNRNLTSNAEANDLLSRTCVAAKADGIEIYSITFGGSISATTETMMKNCATAESYYYHASGTGSIEDVFKNIGYRLSELRLVK